MKDVVIIGGGIAGMYAALKFKNEGYNVSLIEKNNRLGGHIYTLEIDGVPIETGAGRFNNNHTLLLKLLKAYNIKYKEINNVKSFIPIIHGECRKNEIVDINKIVKKVLRKASTMTDDKLYKITFNQLCEIALGIPLTRTFIEAFGYNAEFYINNAYVGVKTFKEDFTNKYKYYSCIEGFSSLIESLEQELIDKKVNIYKNILIKDYKSDKNNRFILNTTNGKFTADKLIFAVPKNELMNIPLFSDYAKGLFDKVSDISLHRIYAKYKSSWFKDVIKTTTDIPIRQFIPIDYDKSIAMVSYSDFYDADYWNILANQGNKVLDDNIHKQLSLIFPDKKIPKTTVLQSFYWEYGTHAWKPGVNPYEIKHNIQNLIDNVFIVGEAYSMRQGWIEGALETVEEVLQLVKSSKQTGGEKQLNIDALKKKYEGEWVIIDIKDGKGKRIIDISEWKKLHPGGDKFTGYMYEDITNRFISNSFHFDNNKLKEIVKKMIDKYTKGFITNNV
jgi:monoamine oxidase